MLHDGAATREMVRSGEYEAAETTCSARLEAPESRAATQNQAARSAPRPNFRANLVTYFTPPGATSFKIDLPVAPGNCPF
jgi:hypothetical protein